MHSINGAALATWREKLFTPHGTRHYVANEGVALRQISCEVHFFPLVALLDAETWKTEV